MNTGRRRRAIYEKIDTPGQREAFREERKRLSENHFNRANTLGAWLLATLVATNVAAAVASLSRAKDAPTFSDVALVFGGGTVLAILSGFFAVWEAGNRSALYYWESYGEENITEEGLLRVDKLVGRAPRLTWSVRVLNMLSLACLVAGMFLAWLAT